MTRTTDDLRAVLTERADGPSPAVTTSDAARVTGVATRVRRTRTRRAAVAVLATAAVTAGLALLPGGVFRSAPSLPARPLPSAAEFPAEGPLPQQAGLLAGATIDSAGQRRTALVAVIPADLGFQVFAECIGPDRVWLLVTVNGAPLTWGPCTPQRSGTYFYQHDWARDAIAVGRTVEVRAMFIDPAIGTAKSGPPARPAGGPLPAASLSVAVYGHGTVAPGSGSGSGSDQS